MTLVVQNYRTKKCIQVGLLVVNLTVINTETKVDCPVFHVSKLAKS